MKKIDPRQITSMVAAGNTTMSLLLLSLMPWSIRPDPYVPTVNIYPQVSASEIDLIRSKAAVFAAIKSMMDYVGRTFKEIATFYVAGGFGSYLDIPKAIGVGLLPDIYPDKIRFVGNSSLMGARLCLLSSHAMERALQIARSMTNIELSNYPPFMDEYVAAMFLPHTDRRLFPSIAY